VKPEKFELCTKYNFATDMEQYGNVLPMLLQRVAWMPIRISGMIFGSFEVRGIEHIERLDGNVIIASNHASELDPLFIVASLPFFSRHMPLFFVSRESGFYTKGLVGKIYGGRFFKMMGAYPAYSGLRDYKESLRHHLAIAKKQSLCIFPTGDMQETIDSTKARGGVAYLAKETALPVVPVRIQGLERTTLQDFFFLKKKIILSFGKPLFSEELFENKETGGNEYQKAARKLMSTIEGLG
jgi:1-acyl-sn-glycerol-3-phosphate acyltransferase